MQQRLYTKHLESALLAEQELIAVKCELEMATSRLAYHKSCVKAFAQ